MDYGAKLQALIDSDQPTDGENGWPILLDVANRYASIRLDLQGVHAAAIKDRAMLDPDDEFAFFLDPSVFDPQLGDDIDWSPELALPAAMEQHGLLDELDRASAAPRMRYTIPVDPGDALAFLNSFPREEPRILVRDRLALSLIRCHAGDERDLPRALRHALGIAHGMSRLPFLIDLSMTDASDNAICDFVVQIPWQDLDGTTIDAIGAEWEAQPPRPARSYAMEGERLVNLAFIPEMFTDDGHGDGHIKADPLGGGDFLADIKLRFTYPSRSETVETVNTLFDGAIALTEQDARQRLTAPCFDFEDHVASISKYDELAPITASLLSKFVPPDRDITRRAGIRVLIGIEQYRQHRGRLPETLDDLVPTFIPTADALVDPTHGGDFVYRVLPKRSADDLDYLLYSTWIDMNDDSATADFSGTVRHIKSFFGDVETGGWDLPINFFFDFNGYWLEHPID